MEFLMEYHLAGIMIGVATFLIIGIFHPLVTKGEYYFGVRIWWIFLLMGILGNFVNFGIDERTPIIGQFGMIFAPRRAVHDEQADAFTDLGSRKPYALGLLEREEHILDQLFNFGIVGSDLPAFFAQYRRPENNYRINHNFFPFLTRPQPEN